MITDATTAHWVHYTFEWLALAVALLIYRKIGQRQGRPRLIEPGMFVVVVGALLGAAMGNKLLFWIQFPHIWRVGALQAQTWLAGQSIVGGLLGGWLGVEMGKRVAGITRRTGDDFVVPILVGIVIGRVGCFLAGLHDGTYGLPTDMPWGVDFGDGLSRHPTQLYEMMLALAVLITWPRWSRYCASQPGLAFRLVMLAYLLWRFAIDMIKPVPFAYAFGWSGIQWVCLGGAGLIVLGLVRDYRRRLHV